MKITGQQLVEAARVIKQHLDEEWIVDGCDEPGNTAFGCASCRAVRLKKALDALVYEIQTEDAE